MQLVRNYSRRIATQRPSMGGTLGYGARNAEAVKASVGCATAELRLTPNTFDFGTSPRRHVFAFEDAAC